MEFGWSVKLIGARSPHCARRGYLAWRAFVNGAKGVCRPSRRAGAGGRPRTVLVRKEAWRRSRVCLCRSC